MPAYKNQRELDEMQEEEFQEADKELSAKPQTEKETNWEKRYGDLRRSQEAKEQDYKSRLAQMEKQVEGFRNGTLKPPKTRDEIDEWRSQYPEFGDVLESWMSQVVEDKTKNLKEETLKIKRERAILDLRKLVPDAETLLANDEFHSWMTEQSDLEKQKIYNSFDIKSAAAVLNRYKSETGKSNKSDVDDDYDPSEAAKSVRTRGRNGGVDENSQGYEYSESQIEEMSKRDPKWWDANEEKVLNALRRNKVLLDLSGGARR